MIMPSSHLKNVGKVCKKQLKVVGLGFCPEEVLRQFFGNEITIFNNHDHLPLCEVSLESVECAFDSHSSVLPGLLNTTLA